MRYVSDSCVLSIRGIKVSMWGGFVCLCVWFKCLTLVEDGNVFCNTKSTKMEQKNFGVFLVLSA